MGDTLGISVGVGLATEVGLGSVVGEGVRLGISVGDGVVEGSSVGLGVCDGVTEGAPTGSVEDALFCGCEVVLATKSALLLFVSSPFPPNSSSPPEPIEASVDDGFAFLSTLDEAVGTIKDVPSPSGLSGAPNVIASTKVPVFAGSFLMPKLLLLPTVSVDVLSQVSVADRDV